MKHLTFTHNGSTRIGKLIGEQILDFSIARPDLPTYVVRLLTAGDAALGQARNAREIPIAMMVAFKDVRLKAPVLKPSKFLAVGMNYKDHAQSPVNNLLKPLETVMADQTNFFAKKTKVFEQFSIPAVDMAVPAESLVCRHILSSWKFLTPSRVLPILLLSFAGTFLFPPSLTMAQTAASSSAAATKQMQKEQQKADRKARRAEKNAELKKSEKNGYQPGWGDNADAQQSLQNAPRKAKSPKAGNASPASAP